MPCRCTSCGPAARDGWRRCAITLHPMVVLWRGKYICQDCWEFCETRRKVAVAAFLRERRSGERHVAKRARLRSNAEATAQEQAAVAAPQEHATVAASQEEEEAGDAEEDWLDALA